ncbi:MAG: aminotransferase class I/II-fold pyridoxal phosphate-dependent enzyme, partial [Candidatus Acidiferrales bacterium]
MASSVKTEETFRLSDRVNRIAASPTMMVVQAADQLKSKGVDVADFGAGEPDFPTPDHIKRAAIKALEENRTKYTPVPGIGPLRQGICDWHARELGSAYQSAECVVTVGGKQAIFNAVCSLINPGDEVIIAAPYWVSYPDIVKYAGGVPVVVETTGEDDFILRAAQVEKAITPRTRIVIANSPSNPTGGVIPPEELRKILAVCERKGVWLMSDECYSHFTYGDAKPYSIASVANSKNALIIIGSMSKTFAMTGWRVGYALAPQPLIAAMTKLQGQST